jgi:hypothetical protein
MLGIASSWPRVPSRSHCDSQVALVALSGHGDSPPTTATAIRWFVLRLSLPPCLAHHIRLVDDHRGRLGKAPTAAAVATIACRRP